MKYLHSLVTLILLTSLSALAQPTHPAITSWIQNTTGITGRHYIKGNPTPVVDTFQANCQLVQYSADYSYVRANGIPAYVIGPYQDGNPAQAVGRNYLFKIPLKPQVNSGTKTTVGLGHIAVLINGVPVYNYADARSYNNANVWHQNAIVFERTGFDCAKGHPAPLQTGPPGPGGGGGTQGQYHHHQDPSAFNIAKVKMSDVCDMYLADGLYVPDATKHGPLIGYSFDGYPIYGAYGWVDEGGKQVVKRITPSYRLRSITDRTTLADGTKLTGTSVGPTLTQQALGSYAEDYEFVAGSGDLDVHNGRFCKTPEYPEGTYAYFATIDADGNSVYPYVIGPTYYGVVVTDNFAVRGPGAASTNVVIREAVQTYLPTTTNPNVVITSTAVLTGKVGTPYSYSVKAENNVKATITYSLLAGPKDMTIDSTTGVITWAAPMQGTHVVTVQASIVSGGKPYTSKQTYSLVIQGNAPVTVAFTSTPVLTGTEGKAYSYRVRARASDTTLRVTYRLGTAPSGMTLSMGTLSWASPVKGTYPLTITALVQGDTATAQQSFTLVINPDTTTSVDEDAVLSTVTVFPNPANDVVIIQVTTPMTESASVDLIDLNGRIVRRSVINQGSTMCFLDVQSLYAGAYVARITRGGSSINLPVIVSE